MRLPKPLTRIVDIGLLLAAVVAGGAIYTRHQAEDDDISRIESGLKIELTGRPVVGAPNAPVVVAEFSDFHCPSCIAYSRGTFPDVRRDLIDTGRIQYAYVNSPLQAVHPEAVAVARAGVCAERRKIFWAVHEDLFGAGKGGNRTAKEVLTGAAFRPDEYDACVNDASVDSVITRDLITGQEVGITGTPTFLFGRRNANGDVTWLLRSLGAKSAAMFVRTVSRLMKEAE